MIYQYNFCNVSDANCVWSYEETINGCGDCKLMNCDPNTSECLDDVV